MFMPDLISIISECVIASTGFIISYFTLRKSSKEIGHRLLASATLLIGFYGLSIVIYDITAIAELVHFFLRFGIISLFFGVMLLYFAFQVIVHTKEWLSRKANTLPYIIGISIYAIVFYAWPDAITIVQLTPFVDSKVSIIILGILGVGILGFLISTMMVVYRFGIKYIEGEKRKKMEIVEIGYCICLIALFVNIASNIVEEGALFDVLFFLIMAIGMIVIAYGFLKPVSQ